MKTLCRVKEGKPKVHIVYDSIYIKCWEKVGKFWEIVGKWLSGATDGKWGVTANGYGVSFWND